MAEFVENVVQKHNYSNSLRIKGGIAQFGKTEKPVDLQGYAILTTA